MLLVEEKKKEEVRLMRIKS